MISSNYINNKLYKNVLRETYGIGQTKMSYKDYLLSMLFTNECYVEETSSSTTSTQARFVGIVNSDFSLSSYIGFFDNDDHAMAFGVPVGGDYYLSQQNTYGMPFGMRKKVSEPYAE